MKWVGQNIYNLISRFRNDVYLEDISTGTIASGSNLGLDSNNKIVKAAEATGDITSVVAGTNITGGGTSGDVTLNVPTASDSTKGAVELATTAETTTGTDADRAVTPDGLKDGYQGSTNVTTLGTIATGVWQGTAIATDQQKHKTSFELTGYSVADGTNYFYSNIMSGNKAPFLHDVNIGSDGLTADNPAAFLRANGTVMPYAGTLKIWKGWAASNGTPTVDVGIFKYTPTANDATNASLVLVKGTQFTGAGNDNLKTFSETSFSVAVAAGDILITAIKGSTNNKTAYFVSTVEIEWS